RRAARGRDPHPLARRPLADDRRRRCQSDDGHQGRGRRDRDASDPSHAELTAVNRLRIAAPLIAAAVIACRAAPSSSVREDAYRANNRGVAMLEQLNSAAAAEEFRRARRLAPALTLPRINLAIALFYLPD